MNEEVFLQQIARRLGRERPLTTAPPRDVVGAPEFWNTYSLPMDERIERFKRELADLGGEAEDFASIADLRQGLRQRLAALAPGRVACWGGTFVEDFGLAEVLAPYETIVWEPQAAQGVNGTTGAVDVDGDDPKALYTANSSLVGRTAQVDVGITGCDFAIADTGTVALACDSYKGRSVSLLPATHIVLIRASQLYTRLGEALAAFIGRGRHPGEFPSSLNFITGPSRSSDIENDLSIGVHGPAAVIAMIVRQQ